MTAIRDYIKLQGRVDLHNIANHFRLPESAVTQMLNFWVKKEVISVIRADSQSICQSQKCSSCSYCINIPTVIYEWL